MKDGKSSDSILGVDIKDVQKIELDILLEFDRICKKHNINYQLYSGTLIGAIRHKGFIPWDDDIDVAMLREDYDQFLTVIDNELPDDYFFQTYETDPSYMNKFAKIRKNDTIFMEEMVQELDMHHGVYIDIFAFDNIKPDSIDGKKQIKLLRSIDRLFKYRIKYRYENMEPGYERIKARFKYNFIKTLPVTKLEVENKVLNIMKKFNGEKTEYVADLANPSKETLDTFMMKRTELEDSILWEFEKYKFPVPKNYDSVLTRAYGDYMKLPEPNQRFSHHDIVTIDLDPKK